MVAAPISVWLLFCPNRVAFAKNALMYLGGVPTASVNTAQPLTRPATEGKSLPPAVPPNETPTAIRASIAIPSGALPRTGSVPYEDQAASQSQRDGRSTIGTPPAAVTAT